MGSSGPRSLNDSCSKAQCGWGPHCVPRGFPAVCGSLRQIDLLPNQRHSCHDSSFWTFHKLQYLCPYHTKVWVIQPMWQDSHIITWASVCVEPFIYLFFSSLIFAGMLTCHLVNEWEGCVQGWDMLSPNLRTESYHIYLFLNFFTNDSNKIQLVSSCERDVLTSPRLLNS